MTMLQSLLQVNSYQNNAVLQAVSGAKPDLIANDQKAGRAPKMSDSYQITARMDSINKAIDDKVTEFFDKYPNGGSDQDVAQFLDSVKFAGG